MLWISVDLVSCRTQILPRRRVVNLFMELRTSVDWSSASEHRHLRAERRLVDLRSPRLSSGSSSSRTAADIAVVSAGQWVRCVVHCDANERSLAGHRLSSCNGSRLPDNANAILTPISTTPKCWQAAAGQLLRHLSRHKLEKVAISAALPRETARPASRSRL